MRPQDPLNFGAGRRAGGPRPRGAAVLTALAACALAACPIAPDNFSDAGPDGGTPAADGGADAGTPTAGTISCQSMGAASAGSGVTWGPTAGAWSAGDLAGTTSSYDGTSYTVVLNASNASFGTLVIQLSALSAGSTNGSLDGISWQAPASSPVQDSWSCAAGGACSGAVTIQTFDGVNLIGNFSVQFFVGSSTSGADSASLSGGTFSVVLPH